MFPAARPNWALVLITVAAMPAFGQPAGSSASAPNPAPPVELTHRSTFNTYRSFTDEKVGSWRDANDAVGRIGGWRAYAKEGREPAGQSSPKPAGSGTPAQPTPASSNPHEGHGKQ
jgi:hypothetical protein